jgi:hypothetical protein
MVANEKKRNCTNQPSLTAQAIYIIADDVISYSKEVLKAKNAVDNAKDAVDNKANKKLQNNSSSPKEEEKEEKDLKKKEQRLENESTRLGNALEAFYALLLKLTYCLESMDNIDHVDFFSKIAQSCEIGKASYNGTGKKPEYKLAMSNTCKKVSTQIKTLPSNKNTWELALAILAAMPEETELLSSIAEMVADCTVKSSDILEWCKNPTKNYNHEKLKVVMSKILPNIRTLPSFIEAISEVETIIGNKKNIDKAKAKDLSYSTTEKKDFLLEAWNRYLTNRATTNSWWTVDEMKALMDQSQNKSHVVNMFSSILKQIQDSTNDKDDSSLPRYEPILVKIFDLAVEACGNSDDVTGVNEVFNYLSSSFGKKARNCLIGTVLKSKDSGYVNALRSYLKEHFPNFSLEE